jgi:DNA (cytosine-5)-methyltransferase 1
MHSFIEVCAGCGGLSKGFMDAGFKPLLINEIDKTACETLRKNHPDQQSRIFQGSMTELCLQGQSPDVLMGGVPCQAFSHAGERRGLEDPRGQLILEFNRLVNECRPKFLLVENVRGLATHEKGKTLKSLIELFSNGGLYEVQYKMLNAGDYGVPQKRERIIIVGTRTDLNLKYEFPDPVQKKVLLKEVLENVPPSDGEKYSEEKRRVLEMVPPGGCWVNLPIEIQKAYMGKAFNSGGGRRGMARRLSMDEQCLTLTTSPAQKQTERCHPLETRPFTVREYARIQTFPDEYQFCGSVSKQYRQIGNAVPVRMAYHLSRSIKKLLDFDIDTKAKVCEIHDSGGMCGTSPDVQNATSQKQ